MDTNSDGICDHGQPYPQEGTDRDLSAVSEDKFDMPVLDEKMYDDNSVPVDGSQLSIDNNITSISGIDDSKSVTNNATGGRLSYYLGPIILIISILYGVSYLLSTRHIIKVVVHRRIWNVILLISTIISTFLGLVLILGIEFGIDISFPFNSLLWHVEAGIAMGLIALFHIAWHWRYFQKMIKHTDLPPKVAPSTE
ncbi:hypothetical protein ACFLTL_02225 [Chloroflexota bacterium]